MPPAGYLAIRRDIVLPPAQRHAFETVRTGAIIGELTARKYGLQPGDHLMLVPDIWPNTDGQAWDFDIVGVFTSTDRTADLSAAYLNYDYFDTYRAWGKGRVSLVLAGLKDAAAAGVVATRIDARFANSASETVTSSERAYGLGFADQLGSVGLMLSVILVAVLFTIALLAANTMAESVRERTAELAVLRVLGFRRGTLSLLVLAEAFAIALLGALPGLLLARLLIGAGKRYITQLGGASIDPSTLAVALLVAAALAAVAGLPPALRVQRMEIVDALRHA